MALSDAAPLLATTSSLVAPSGGVGAPADDDEAGDCFVAGAASRATREEQLLSLLFDARGAVDGDGAGMGVHEGEDTQRGAYGAAEPTAQQQAFTYPVAPSAPSQGQGCIRCGPGRAWPPQTSERARGGSVLD